MVDETHPGKSRIPPEAGEERSVWVLLLHLQLVFAV